MAPKRVDRGRILASEDKGMKSLLWSLVSSQMKWMWTYSQTGSEG